MAPPSTQAPAASTKAHRSSSSRPESKASNRQSQAPAPPPSIHYTLLIRLPFPRGDFEDPPLVSDTMEEVSGHGLIYTKVEWDASKDKKLWKIISKNPKSGDIDCKSGRLLLVWIHLANDNNLGAQRFAFPLHLYNYNDTEYGLPARMSFASRSPSCYNRRHGYTKGIFSMSRHR